MKKLLYISALYLCCFACADLEELAPINSIPTDQAITDRASAQAALTGVYDGLQESDFDRWLSLAQYFSDEANATGTFLSRLEFGNLNVFPANTTMGTVFTEIYEKYKENFHQYAICEHDGIDPIPKLESSIKNRHYVWKTTKNSSRVTAHIRFTKQKIWEYIKKFCHRMF